MLGARKVPNGEARASPPPSLNRSDWPGEAWQAAQSAASNRTRPLSGLPPSSSPATFAGSANKGCGADKNMKARPAATKPATPSSTTTHRRRPMKTPALPGMIRSSLHRHLNTPASDSTVSARRARDGRIITVPFCEYEGSLPADVAREQPLVPRLLCRNAPTLRRERVGELHATVTAELHFKGERAPMHRRLPAASAIPPGPPV
jgi:hypothetical protein